MTALQAAIVTAWAGNGTLAAAPLFLDQAPPGQAFPYSTYSIVPGSTPRLAFQGGVGDRTYYEPVVVQFSMFCEGSGAAASAKALQDAAHTQFDKTRLTLSSGTNISTLRQDQFVRLSGRGASDQPVYQAVSTYRFLVEREFSS